MVEIMSGFPHLVESPEIFFVDISEPRTSYKMSIVLQSSRNKSLWSWKVLENENCGYSPIRCVHK